MLVYIISHTVLSVLLLKVYRFKKEVLLLYQELLRKQKVLEQQIQQFIQELALYPPGHLRCAKNGKYVKNLHIHNGTCTHISKKNKDFINTLAVKKYLSAQLKDLQQEQLAIDSFLKQYQNYTPEIQQLMENPLYHDTILSAFKPLSKDLEKWQNEPYVKNVSHPEQLRHSSPSGHVLRSKSEVLIDQTLFLHRIPFRYECEQQFNDLTIYPDFTIRHPESGKLFYWEHFGMMDKPSYSYNAFQKLQLYSSHGYIPSINLITSYETNDHPLTTETIEQIIHHYFL